MDKLIAAIQRAIEGGAAQARPSPAYAPGSDAAYVHGQVNVDIDQTVLDQYLAELRAIPEIAKCEGAISGGVLGGGMSVSVESIGPLVLARALISGDIAATCRSFLKFVQANVASCTAVMAVSGVSVDEEIKLGRHITLRPITSLPPSVQRGTALKQPASIHAALTADISFAPVFFRPNEPPAGPPASIINVLNLLDEARLVLGLLGAYPALRTFWLQPHDFLFTAAAVFGSSVQYAPEDYFTNDVHVLSGRASELASRYFDLSEQVRTKFLRIPMDRLNRAGRERDLADRSIDLGIALEALLLHNVGDARDRGELRFRMSLRGAWLAGVDANDREEKLRILKALYDLRSQAVHAGAVPITDETRKTLHRATEVCQQLIQTLIDKKCKLDWDRLLLGF